jgi:carbamate kinase
LLLLTDVPAVLADYGLPTQHPIDKATVEEMRAMTFPPGSMGPKVESVCRFVEATGNFASIGTFVDAPGLLDGSAGTRVVP